MKQTLDFNDFRNAFWSHNRTDNFSRKGLELLFDYLEEYEGLTGEEIELDVIALCCDYSEEAAQDIFNTYPISCDSDSPTDDEVINAVRDYLRNNTSIVGETSSGFVYANF